MSSTSFSTSSFSFVSHRVFRRFFTLKQDPKVFAGDSDRSNEREIKRKENRRETSKEKNYLREVGMMAKKKKTSGKKITKTPRFIFSKYFYSPYYDFRKKIYSFTCFLMLLFLMSQSIRYIIMSPLCIRLTKRFKTSTRILVHGQGDLPTGIVKKRTK